VNDIYITKTIILYSDKGNILIPTASHSKRGKEPKRFRFHLNAVATSKEITSFVDAASNLSLLFHKPGVLFIGRLVHSVYEKSFLMI
jgi:hypothetical protein